MQGGKLSVDIKVLKDMDKGQLIAGCRVRSRASTRARLDEVICGYVLKQEGWTGTQNVRARYFEPETGPLNAALDQVCQDRYTCVITEY